MPTFPDGSRVWITDGEGKPLSEYGEHVEVNEALKTHMRTVYIPAEKGAEFQVHYSVKQSQTTHSQVHIWLDGTLAKKRHANSARTSKVMGWYPDPMTLQRFAFGDVDTNEDAHVSPSANKAEQLQNSSIEVRFWDALISKYVQSLPSRQTVAIASAVHPDSKVASLLGCQVKPGRTTTLSKPHMGSHVKLKYREGALKYTARFAYRPMSLLVAMELAPDPNPAALDDANVQAGPSINKRKRNALDVPDAGAQVAESEEQRKKRLTEELLAIKQELGDEAVMGALLKPKNADHENAQPAVKKEQGGQSSAIDVDAAPKNQKIFLDLSLDSDDEA